MPKLGLILVRNLDLVRPIGQVDIKNDITQIINWEFDDVTGFPIPQEMVNGENNGIKHSFEITRDAFAELEGLGLSPQLLDLYMSLPDAPEEQWMEDENFVRKPDLYFSADDSHPGLSKPFSQNREIIRFWLHAIDAYNVVTEWREETNN